MKWLARLRNQRLLRRIADLESALDAAARKLAVSEAEVASLAAVVARDRARVEAETAMHTRDRAIAEGVANERTDAGVRRFSA
jgi:hypothetical protein